jgi:hypothetical protein
MNKNYRGWTVDFYAGQIPERVYSAERRDRNSGVTTTLYAPSRADIERAVDTFIQQHDPCPTEPIALGI